MADDGLLSGANALGLGLQAGVESYQRQASLDDERQYRRKMLSMQMLKGGYKEDEVGNMVETPEAIRARTLEEQTKKAALLKTGYQPIQTGDAYTGIEKIPGFHDIEEENKRLMNQKLQKELTEGKKPTKDEFAASGYAQRLEQAEDVFSKLNHQGYDATGMLSQVEKSPRFPGFLKDENTKLQEQAETNFINAVLRRESGAAISPSEFTSARQQYFPQANDPLSVLQEKARNREIVRNNLRAESGHAYEKSGGGLLPGSHPTQDLMPGISGAQAAPGGSAHPQDQAAVQWAKSHPGDPRAQKIMRLNGL